jgi:catechol 2,3-dioxygenase-like lactoylglutathione lyase family enzyme
MNLGIKGLQHIGIPVTNLEVSVPFYASLGFIDTMQASFQHEGEAGKCIMMKQGDLIIELYQLPDSALSDIAARTDGPIDHIALGVKNIDETFSIMKKSGFTIPEDSPVFLKFWEKGCRYFNIIGPDGEKLEFNQIL